MLTWSSRPNTVTTNLWQEVKIYEILIRTFEFFHSLQNQIWRKEGSNSIFQHQVLSCSPNRSWWAAHCHLHHWEGRQDLHQDGRQQTLQVQHQWDQVYVITAYTTLYFTTFVSRFYKPKLHNFGYWINLKKSLHPILRKRLFYFIKNLI